MAMTLRRAIAATTLIAVVLALTSSQAAQVTAGESRYQVTGLVLSVDPARLTFVASIDRIPGFMEAMTMPFKARQANDLAGIAPGTAVAFTLVVERGGSYVDGIRVGRSQNLEQDPLAARRLSLLRQMSGPASRPLAVGDLVPDVELIDQHSRRVSLGAARGKVIGINFMYTTCQLPDFCLRLVNHFSVLQQRLPEALGRDLELLTVTFDPLRDTPDALAEYARRWRPSGAWHFLTGDAASVRRLLDAFGVDTFPNDGLMDHSLRTVFIDRSGRLAAVVDGNQYSSDQLVDLARTMIGRGR